MSNGRPGWQCVLMCWCTKDLVRAINHRIDALHKLAAGPLRLVPINDAPCAAVV